MSTQENQDPLLQAFENGELFAYPTEAVFGLGCDPNNQSAVEAILELKQRPMHKGLILVALNYSQLLPFVNDKAVPMDRRTEIFSSWPGPVTWLLPKSENAPDWITGGSEFIAVRVSAHPVVRDLCQRFNSALVSTSANQSSQEPARSAEEVRQYFPASQLNIIEGELGGSDKPTSIRHGFTGEVIRAS